MGDLLPSGDPDERSSLREDFDKVREACREADIDVPAKVVDVLQVEMRGIVAIGSLEETLARTADVEKTREAAVARAEAAEGKVGELESRVSQTEASIESDKDRRDCRLAAANEKLEPAECPASGLEAALIAVQQKLLSARDVQREIRDSSRRVLEREES